jgi:hypothetical protein
MHQSQIKAQHGGMLNERWLLLFPIVLFFLWCTGYLFDPYIAHDDFDWLIPQGFDQGFESPWSKAGSEGRWINYPWSLLSVHLSPNQAFFIFVGLACTAALLASKAITGRPSLVAGLLLFFSPAGAAVSQWPVTQITSMLFLFAGLFALNLVKSFKAEMTLLSLLVIVSFLSYPAYAPLSAILFAASRTRSNKQIIVSAAVYVCAFAMAILIAFSLNYFLQGNFGIKVAGWRHPTPLLPDGDLILNIKKYSNYWSELTAYWPAAIASISAYCLCFVSGVQTRRCMSILIMSALIIGMEASMSIISGLELPARTSLWFWAALCSPIIFITASGRFNLFGIACAALTLLTGLFAWATLYTNYAKVFPAMKYLGQEITLAEASNAGKFHDIIVFGDKSKNSGLKWMHSNRHLRNYLFKVNGIYTRSCKPDECSAIEQHIASETSVAPVEIINDNLVLIISDKSGDTY